MDLDSVISNCDTRMTYRERIELAIGDSRGNFAITDELNSVEGAVQYAKERINFWLNWNEEYKKNNKDTNTQKRYIEAQIASEVYARAVYKSLESMFVSKILENKSNTHAVAFLLFQKLLFIYSSGSLLIMKFSKKTILCIIKEIKSKNFSLGLYFEMNIKNLDESALKNWIKKAI